MGVVIGGYWGSSSAVGDVLGVVIGVLLLPWGCVGGSYWRFFFCRGDVLGVVIGVLLLPWGCVGGSYWGSSSAVGMCWV